MAVSSILADTSICFIGSGVMAEAMIAGIVGQQLVKREAVTASDPRRDRLQELAATHGINTAPSNVAAAKGSEIVVLSVKPQVVAAVLDELHGQLQPQQLVLSIVTGASISTMRQGLRHEAIVRVMPNTPAQIGQGTMVWTATPTVTPQQREQSQAILGCLGKDIYVDDEDFLDMATAVSGSGPAYVFLVMEALIDAAVHLGFSRHVAQEMVIQTMLGSVLLAKQTGKHPAELRNMVTSPGGTSAEAIYQLEKGAMRTVFSRAIYAAYEKARLLGEISKEAYHQRTTR